MVEYKVLSECQHNFGNHICTNRFYYNIKNDLFNQIIERHNAQSFLNSNFHNHGNCCRNSRNNRRNSRQNFFRYF